MNQNIHPEGEDGAASAEAASAVAARQDDGGPAFPTFEPVEQFQQEAGRYETIYLSQGGMTLRQYFAAKALQGILTHGGSYGHIDGKDDDTRLAALAWAYADAMLQARRTA